MTRRSFALSFTSKVILKLTAAFLLAGTAIFFFADPGIVALPSGERFLASGRFMWTREVADVLREAQDVLEFLNAWAEGC